MVVATAEAQLPDMALYREGISYKDKRMYTEAIRSFSEFISLYPKEYPDVYNKRGQVYLVMKAYEQANADFERHKELEPENPYPHYMLGKFYFQTGDYQNSVDAFTEAVKLNGLFKEAYNDRGMSLCRLSDFGGAIWDFRKAISLDSTFAMAHNNMGVARFFNQDVDNPSLQDIREAKRYFAKAIEQDKEFGIAYRNQGVMLLLLKEYDFALKSLEQASKLSPSEPMTPFFMGVVYHLQGELGYAQAELQKALKNDPDFYFAFEELGDIKAGQKKWSKALFFYETAATRSKNRSSVFEGLMYYKMAVVSAWQKDKSSMYKYLNQSKKSGAFNDKKVYSEFLREKSFTAYRAERKMKKFTKAINKLKKDNKFLTSELRWFRMHK